MRRMSLILRRPPGRDFASAAAVALSLAGGAVLVTAASGSPALAQQRQQKPANSEKFSQVYEPLAAIVNAEGGDYAAAKAQVPAVLAAVETADDRNLAGNLILVLGNKLKDQEIGRAH